MSIPLQQAVAEPPPALALHGLVVGVQRGRRVLTAVDGVSLAVPPGGALGLVGESGSGKSLTLRAAAGLLPAGARVLGGRASLDGHELPLEGKGLRAARRGVLGIVFQDPLAALNPVQTVGSQVAEAPRHVLGMRAAAARSRALELLDLVGLPDPSRVADSFPHELSGGQRQRAVIATALSTEPRVLLCDEPTTALDVSVQAQVLALLARLQAELGLTLVLVSHDLAVVRQVCPQVAVMYAGRVVETGDTVEVLDSPRHPYTAALLGAALDVASTRAPRPVPGEPPELGHPRSRCPFAPRCALVREDCVVAPVPLLPQGPGRESACLHVDEMGT